MNKKVIFGLLKFTLSFSRVYFSAIFDPVELMFDWKCILLILVEMKIFHGICPCVEDFFASLEPKEESQINWVAQRR